MEVDVPYGPTTRRVTVPDHARLVRSQPAGAASGRVGDV